MRIIDEQKDSLNESIFNAPNQVVCFVVETKRRDVSLRLSNSHTTFANQLFRPEKKVRDECEVTKKEVVENQTQGKKWDEKCIMRRIFIVGDT